MNEIMNKKQQIKDIIIFLMLILFLYDDFKFLGY